MSGTRTESVPDLLATLEADLARMGPAGNASVSEVYLRDGRYRVAVAVEGASRSMAWNPRFRLYVRACEYRRGALDLLGRWT